MSHLVTLVLLVAAVLAYVAGITPVVGAAFIAAGVVFEFVGWWRIKHPAEQAAAEAPVKDK